jgi:hypothetical protein
LLDTHGVGDGRCEFVRVWSAVREWVRTAAGEALKDEFQVGFECSRNPHSESDLDDYPVPPDGLPPGPVFNVVFLWDFGHQGETGVELWFTADADWDALTADPEWDPDHQIGFHFWGFAGPGANDYIANVESTAYAQLAARKPASLVRVFGSRGFELIVRCSQ